jgi:hypothetical protein
MRSISTDQDRATRREQPIDTSLVLPKITSTPSTGRNHLAALVTTPALSDRRRIIGASVDDDLHARALNTSIRPARAKSRMNRLVEI